MRAALSNLIKRVLGSSPARFFIGGWPGTTLYYVVLYVLTEGFGREQVSTWSLIASFANYVSNFYFEKWWVWENPGTAELPSQGAKYLLLFVAGTIANMVLLHLIVTYTHLWYMFGPIVVGAIITVANYFGSKYILGKKDPGARS